MIFLTTFLFDETFRYKCHIELDLDIDKVMPQETNHY